MEHHKRGCRAVRETLLQYLACPECGAASLTLTSFSTEGDVISAGRLACGSCLRLYPIIEGVPRLLPDGLMGALPAYYPDFFRRWDGALPPVQDDQVARTLAFYSYARAKLFTDAPTPQLTAYWRQSLETRIPGIAELRGQVGLDAGCGEGRYTYCLAQAGASVIGLDLSCAVDLAQRRNGANPRAHIVQGSIYQPPLRREALDFVVSTGVLHHLPDPEAGFAALTPLLRPGGTARLWVYGLRQMSLVYRLSHLTLLHHLARGLSPRDSYRASVPIAVALELLLFQPGRLLAGTRYRERIPTQLRELAALPFGMRVAEVQDRIGVPVTYYLTSDELRQWFEHAGLQDVLIEATHGGRGWSARGQRAPVDSRVPA